MEGFFYQFFRKLWEIEATVLALKCKKPSKNPRACRVFITRIKNSENHFWDFIKNKFFPLAEIEQT
jgi:hypothetical protein